jgi:hypothetical protein
LASSTTMNIRTRAGRILHPATGAALDSSA